MKNLSRLLLAMCGLILGVTCSNAQTYKTVQNDGTTGTTQFKLAKINASGNAVVMATTDTNGYSGVCVANCGTTGTATLQTSGAVPLLISNTSTADHYVQISGATLGDGLDSGAITFPTAGGDVVGRVQVGAAAAATALVDLFPAEIQAAAASSACTSNFFTNLAATGVASTATTGAANATYLGEFTLTCGGTFGHIGVSVNTSETGNSDLGIYSSSGTLLCHTGASTAFNATGIRNVALLASCVLSANTVYYFSFTTLAGTGAIWCNTLISPYPTSVSSGGTTSGGVLNGSLTPTAPGATVASTTATFALYP